METGLPSAAQTLLKFTPAAITRTMTSKAPGSGTSICSSWKASLGSPSRSWRITHAAIVSGSVPGSTSNFATALVSTAKTRSSVARLRTEAILVKHGGLGLAQLRGRYLPHGDLERLGRLDLLARGDAEVLDLAQLRQQPALHRADGGVVGGGGRGQTPADLVQFGEELGEAGVQRAGGVGDLRRLDDHPLLAPTELHRPQQTDQRGRADDEHVALQGVIEKRRVGGEGGVHRRLVWDEADHQVRHLTGLELALVVLRAEAADVLARLPRVAFELHDALTLDLGLLGIEKGVERHLGVGDEAAALGQHEAGIRAQPAVVRVEGFLQLEVDVLGHSGDLDAAPQLKLAPLPARLRLAQRLLQSCGLRVEVADRLPHLLEQGAGLQVG